MGIKFQLLICTDKTNTEFMTEEAQNLFFYLEPMNFEVLENWLEKDILTISSIILFRKKSLERSFLIFINNVLYVYSCQFKYYVQLRKFKLRSKYIYSILKQLTVTTYLHTSVETQINFKIGTSVAVSNLKHIVQIKSIFENLLNELCTYQQLIRLS